MGWGELDSGHVKSVGPHFADAYHGGRRRRARRRGGSSAGARGGGHRADFSAAWGRAEWEEEARRREGEVAEGEAGEEGEPEGEIRGL